MIRAPKWNRGPKVFTISWRWRKGVDDRARVRVRLAVGGWLTSIGLCVFTFRELGRGQYLYVEGLQGGDNLSTGRIRDPLESGRAIHSFVVGALSREQHEGPIRSGLRTSRRQGVSAAMSPASALRAVGEGLQRLRGR